MSGDTEAAMAFDALGRSIERAKSLPYIGLPAHRPLSDAEDDIDTEFENDSEIEDDQSWRSDVEPQFLRRKSATTVSSYDEVPTPLSSRSGRSTRAPRPFDLQIRPIEGPRGPHLFRSSQLGPEIDYTLQMSPLLPKEPPTRAATSFSEATVTPVSRQCQRDFSIAAALAAPELDFNDTETHIRQWDSHQVVEWMQSCGMDASIIDCFEANDVYGDALLGLKFEDLRDQLNIQSYGKRHQLWSAICSLRGEEYAPSPQPTPFQDISRPCTSNEHRSPNMDSQTPIDGSNQIPGMSGGKKRRGRKPAKINNIATPIEPVSIVAIEQLIPKPHTCNKGERCSKWRKQQRELKQLKKEGGIGRFPISPTKGGRIHILGDPGNAMTADNIVPNVRKQVEDNTHEDAHRVPSAIASSDALGQERAPSFNESTLGQLGNRDPQDNVRHFLSLHDVDADVESPPSPPLELQQTEPVPRSMSVPVLFPSQHHAPYPSLAPPRSFSTPGPRESLRMLPKLEIPRSASAVPNVNTIASPEAMTSACRSAVASPGALYRLGSPESELDVPMPFVPCGPAARNSSQSVPPEMLHRPQVSLARANSMRPTLTESRQASLLPAVIEGEVLMSPSESTHSIPMSTRRKGSGDSVISSKSELETKPALEQQVCNPSTVKQFGYGQECTHAGFMKKRKTKFLRHEWQEAHFRLNGSQLSMHENARFAAPELERINIDDYGVSCSSNVSSNKLSAAMKAFRIKNEPATTAVTDETAFSFQLVPERESDRNGAANGKTHYFAVNTKEDRIDWMRELMLSKALKQKGQGYEVEVERF